MNLVHVLTTAAKNFGTGSINHTASHNAHGEYVRHAPTGDPRLDLAHAERAYR